MSVKFALEHWRSRWDRSDEGLPNKPYSEGAIHKRLMQIPHNSVWSMPGLLWLVVVCIFSFFVLMAYLQFSLNGQISFAALMLLVAFYIRRFNGSLFTLALLGLTLVCATQYFAWRVGRLSANHLDRDLLFSAAVILVELCILTCFVLSWVTNLWPLEQHELASLEESAQFPTIDIAVQVDGLNKAQILAKTQSAAALFWPEKKRAIYWIDLEPRQNIENIAQDSDAKYLVVASDVQASSETQQKQPRQLKVFDALVEFGEGEFLVSIDTTEDLDPNFLRRLTAWFTRDKGLDLLYTASHYLAPKLSTSVMRLFASSINTSPLLSPYPSLFMVRRSSWQNALVLSSKKRLKYLWKQSALVLYRPIAAPIDSSQSSYALLRIDRAESNILINCKTLVAGLYRAIVFYKSLANLFVLALPAICLSTNLSLAQMPWANWFSLVLPFVTLVWLTDVKVFQKGRWGTMKELRELALAVYFLFATSYSFFQTKLRNPGSFFRVDAGSSVIFHSSSSAIRYALIAINGIALLAALTKLQPTSSMPIALSIEWLVTLAVWSLGNVVFLLAQAGVTHEKSQIKSFAESCRQLPAMLRLPYGRTVACHSINFPSKVLSLMVPASGVATFLPVHSKTQVSIFYNQVTYVFEVEILGVTETLLRLRLSENSNDSYNSLCNAVFVRDAKWPKWLPHKSADRPFPEWVYRVLAAVLPKTIDLMTKITTLFRWDLITSIWKKNA